MNGFSLDFVMQLVYPDCKPCSDVKIKCHLTFAHRRRILKKCTLIHIILPFVSITIRSINCKYSFSFAIKNIRHHVQQRHQIQDECVNKKARLSNTEYILDLQLKRVEAINLYLAQNTPTSSLVQISSARAFWCTYVKCLLANLRYDTLKF
jgi:hypothetical protein